MFPDSVTSSTSKPRKRHSPSGVAIVNAHSAKRRRISFASVDLTKEFQSSRSIDLEAETTIADRFVPARPKTALPLYSTPRTNRIARVFGLADDRILNYSDPPSSVTTPDSKAFSLLRKSASQLFDVPSVIPPTSAAANIGGSSKQFLMALDGPGVPTDTYATPITWSLQNYIAVACGNSIYYQNLTTRSISALCKLSGTQHGMLHAIEWAGTQRPNVLALGTTRGTVQLWDSTIGEQIMNKPCADWLSVGGMHWNDEILAVGRADGKVSLFDIRTKGEIKKLEGHKGNVHGVRWSPDGRCLATGDENGSLFIWDSRASKLLCDDNKKGPRMKHRGPVKALSWCPWKPDLLATGSLWPEGTIRIWNTSSLSSPPTPAHTIELNTSVTSLHWSPHCKELLSTHGASWEVIPSGNLPRRFQAVPSPYSYSLTVFSYPTCKRVIGVAAHTGVVGHSCLSPDGTRVFTICPREEAMKMWGVWAKRESSDQKESVFTKCTIR